MSLPQPACDLLEQHRQPQTVQGDGKGLAQQDDGGEPPPGHGGGARQIAQEVVRRHREKDRQGEQPCKPVIPLCPIAVLGDDVTDEVTALKTKSVDAIWIFYAWAGVKTEIEGLETDYFAFADLNPVFDFYTPVIIANNDFLEQEPDTARAFMEAVSKGYQDAVKEPEEAADILCKAAPELDPELVKASQIYLADQYQADAERWGYISPDRWNGYYSWLNEKGLVETPIEENTGFSNDYLP